MLLFRYFGSHALETLQDNLLKAATVSSLNDPFELLYQLAGTMTVAKAKHHLKQRIKTDQFFAVAQLHNPAIRTKKDLKKFMTANRDSIAKKLVSNYPKLKADTFIESYADRTLRIICFSESTVDRLDEILIWSHYANKHRGTRIGFEFPDGITNPFKIVPIQYQPTRIALDLTKSVETDHVKKALTESVKIKSLAWKYEREYRMLAAVPFCVNKPIEGGRHADFVPFKREWVKYVDAGVRASAKEIQAMKEFLQKEYPNVQFRKAVFHPSEFALEYQPV
jgi:Protein of unknown function (DUF2971)